MSFLAKTRWEDISTSCRAEIYQALHVAHSNYTFECKEIQAKRFKLMFPNCPITQGLAQADFKVKYNLQSDIAPYCKFL